MGLTVDTRILKKFKHRIFLCSMQDAVVDNKLVFQKKAIWECWAMVNPRRAQTFNPDGQTILEEKDRRTHFIHTRYNANIEITSAAWIYEKPLKSPPRWFKILFSMDEFDDGKYYKSDCRLMEKTDEAITPTNEGGLLAMTHGILPGAKF